MFLLSGYRALGNYWLPSSCCI